MINSEDKQFILHTGSLAAEIINVEVEPKVMRGEITHQGEPWHYTEERSKSYKLTEKTIHHEVHIYLNESSIDLSEGIIEIPYSMIDEIRVIEKDTGKLILAVLGSILAVFIILIIIVALTKSSCPYVYVDDGEGFVFEGEIFG